MNSSGGHDPVFSSAMREMSRAHIADIWRRGKAGEPLGLEDLAHYQAMLDHPEYTDIWEHAAELGAREVEVDRVNPFLHISLHSVIERQIAERNPPDTEQTLFRLTRAGMDKHEALHRIMAVVSEMMWEMMQQRKVFDRATYQRRLRALRP
jgi:hypothetical protein